MSRFNLDDEGKRRVLTDFELRQLGIRVPYLVIHRRTFRKSPGEKARLKKLKLQHRSLLRRNGYDPNKRLNLNEPQTIKSDLS